MSKLIDCTFESDAPYPNCGLDSLVQSSVDLDLDKKLLDFVRGANIEKEIWQSTEPELAARISLLRRLYSKILVLYEQFEIPKIPIQEILLFHLPFAEELVTKIETKLNSASASASKTSIIGINGSQGSGKSTMTAVISLILEHGYGKKVAAFSIDDFYLTFEERAELAAKVHPLFAVRSVPGTHDTKKAIELIDSIVGATENSVCWLPKFDKSLRGGAGDRVPKENWTKITGPVDIILMEGWLIGCTSQEDFELENPVNEAEKLEDPDKVWRTYSNLQLQTAYKDLFSKIDFLLMIQVGRFKQVLENRELQEQKLRLKLAKTGSVNGAGTMTTEELHNFVRLCERYTVHMMKDLPPKSDLILQIGQNHQLVSLRTNRLV